MFDSLTGKLESVFKKLRGRGVLNEEDVKEALREVRLSRSRPDRGLVTIAYTVSDQTGTPVMSFRAMHLLSRSQPAVKGSIP